MDKADGMGLISDSEKQRLSAVTNYDDTSVKADISALQSGKADKTSLATVATTGSYNDLMDKPETSDYTVFMQDTQPLQDGLWIKGEEKDFMITPYSFSCKESAIISSVEKSQYISFSAVSIGKYAYTFGGLTSGYISNIYKFDFENGSVSSVSTLKSPASGTSAAVIGKNVYIFGGKVSTGLKDYVQIFDPETGTRTDLSATLPNPNAYTCAAAIGKKAYIFGGDATTTAYSLNIVCFDSEKGTCSRLATKLPHAIRNASATTINDKVYIFGGTYQDSENTTIYSSEIICFDPSENTCTTLPIALPHGLSSHATASVNGKAYIFGGYYKESENTTIYSSEIICFDPSKNTCTTLSTVLPNAPTSGASVTINNKIYVFCGYLDGSSFKGNSIFEFTPNEASMLDFTGYFIKTSQDGQFAKTSSNEISIIEKVYDSQTGEDVESYAVFSGTIIRIS